MWFEKKKRKNRFYLKNILIAESFNYGLFELQLMSNMLHTKIFIDVDIIIPVRRKCVDSFSVRYVGFLWIYFSSVRCKPFYLRPILSFSDSVRSLRKKNHNREI